MTGTIAAWLRRRAGASVGPAFLDARDGSALGWADLAASCAAWEELAARRALPLSARVALVVDDPLSFVAAWFGAVACGLAVVPLDPRAPLAEVVRSLRRARARVVVTDRSEVVAGVSSTGVVELWGVDRKCPQLLAIADRAVPDTSPIVFAALLMSSGTTGAPKGIPLTETQLVAAARRIAAHHELVPRDRGFSPLPLFHVNAQVVGLLTTLASGASLVLDGRFEAERYWEVVQAYRPTWLNTVPAVIGALNRLGAPPAGAVEGVRFARSASTALTLDALRRFEELTGIGVLETYGMTEAASQVTANPLERAGRRPGSVGLPVGLELRVVADHAGTGTGTGSDSGTPARVVAPGEVGTVQVRGAAVVEHYLVERCGKEEVAPARDASGWLTTGDAGWLDADGYLYLAGRTDDVIDRGGEKFHPREVEEILAAHPQVAVAAVVPQPHARLGHVPVAFVQLEPASLPPAESTVLEELRSACEASLSPPKRPVRIEVLEKLPTGPSGKVVRVRLRELLREAWSPSPDEDGAAGAAGAANNHGRASILVRP